MNHSHSGYLREVFSSKHALRDTVKACAKVLKQQRAEKRLGRFDYIAVRGVSGLTVGSALAVNQRKGLIVVRKEEEVSHAEYHIEGLPFGTFEYIIVDDFMSSGNTVHKIIKSIDELHGSGQCLGLLQYKYGVFETLATLGLNKI